MQTHKRMNTLMMVDINLLDGTGLQSRAAMNEEVIEEYAQIFREKYHGGTVCTAMAPVSVIYNGATNHYWLTDGFHRVEAAKRAGLKRISCCVNTGSPTDALRDAISANATNGMRRTNEDKHHALTMAWEHRVELFGGEPSNGVLADACGISERTVIRFRASLSTCDNVTGENSETTRIGRDGRKMNVSVGAMVERAQPPLARPQLLDRVGNVVPENTRWAFADKETARSLNGLSAAIRTMEDLSKRNQTAQIVITQNLQGGLRHLLWCLRQNLPYAVCGYCGGSRKDPERGDLCRWCHGTGFLGRHEYDMLPREFKCATSTTSNSSDTSDSSNSSATSNSSNSSATSNSSTTSDTNTESSNIVVSD